MSFNDLDEWFDDALSLPINGKTYVVAPASATVGLYCQRLLSAGATAAAGGKPDMATLLDDDAERSLFEKIMGPVFGQMIEDGVTWPKIQHAGNTVFLWIAQGREIAENYWNGRGPAGEAPAPANRAQKRATARRSTRTAGAPAIPSPDSTNGTKSRQTSKNSSQAAATRSRGSKS